MTKTSEQQSPAVPPARCNRPRISPVVPEESNRDLAGEAAAEERENADEVEAADEDEALAGGPISVILSEPDVLDCSVCYDPLTIPVYQCVNGHIACSSCCTNMRNRCPSCSEKIGDIRCRAIERVLESLKISCSYESHGCQASLSYCSRLLHEETCVYAPCECPFQECDFHGSLRRLSLNLNQQHMDSVIRFRFGSSFSFSLKVADRFLVLQEEKDGTLFILNYANNSMAVRCFESSVSDDCTFSYYLTVRGESSSIWFQSFTKKAPGRLDDPPSVDFLQVPGYFFSSDGRLMLKVWISSK